MHLRFSGLWVLSAVVVLALGTGCSHTLNAQAGLTQSQAEQVSSNIYIANCHLPQPTLTRNVVLGTPNSNGHIREQYGSVMVYPVQVTWSGSCSGHPAGPQQTDQYDTIQARYTANYYKDQFGNWAHTPFIGSCSWVHRSYQPNGSAAIAIPNSHAESCGIADTVNDN